MFQTFTAFTIISFIFEMSLSLGSYKTSETFTQEWTVFIGLWLAFPSGFIARISKGRTIKSF
jgi:glycine betaine transporter